MAPIHRIPGALITIFIAYIAYAILYSHSAVQFDLNGSDMPTVDFGYTIHRASQFNTTGDFYKFSDVRYAAPPTGQRRFQAPQMPVFNRTRIENGTNGNPCPQGIPIWARKLSGLTDYESTGTEDCLFLDIDVPKVVYDRRRRGRGAPVLVWIYGGGYTAGSKEFFGTGAGLLAVAQEPVIYVALNYRLGIFGFTAGPSYLSQGGTANLGLLDQRFALEWIQRHISTLGGDPSRVTIIGESAGAGSILHQITAYGGERKVPFSQAIVQSPGFYPITSDDVMEKDYQLILDAANCSSRPDGLDCLKSLSEQQLKQVNLAAIDAAPYGQFKFGPVVDGSFTPALPGNLLLAGEFDANLRLMIGQNYNEGGNYVEQTTIDAAYFDDYLDIFMPVAKPDVRNHVTKTLYPPPDATLQGKDLAFGEGYPTYSNYPPYYSTWTSLINRFISDATYICLTNYLARAFQNQTYSYMISIPPGTHGIDIPYTFYNGPDPRVSNDTLAQLFQKYLTNFAISGNPNREDLPSMPIYGRQNLVTDINITMIKPLRDPAAKEQCYWLQRALYV